MSVMAILHVYERSDLRDRVRVFADREEAGAMLATLLEERGETDGILLAIPSGGIPVAAPVARALRMPLDVAVVSKVTPPWNYEYGYGAVAFDGKVRLDENLVSAMGLSSQDVASGVERARQRVERRLRILRGDRQFPDLSGETVVLVDDGLATGWTMRAAIHAVRDAGPARIVVATPTGHLVAVQGISTIADTVYCLNIRGGVSFAVAEAYRHWYDVPEIEAAQVLRELQAAEGELQRTP
jgi:predicted phosphoribosyltransferase